MDLESYRRELLAHRYRATASPQDAEDLVRDRDRLARIAVFADPAVTARVQ